MAAPSRSATRSAPAVHASHSLRCASSRKPAAAADGPPCASASARGSRWHSNARVRESLRDRGLRARSNRHGRGGADGVIGACSSGGLGLMPARWPFGAASTSTIRTRIQWLVVACAVPVALLAAVLLVVSYQRGRDALLQDNLLAARTLVQAVDRELDATVQVLQVLATSSSIDDRDYARFHAQARATLRHMAADN